MMGESNLELILCYSFFKHISFSIVLREGFAKRSSRIENIEIGSKTALKPFDLLLLSSYEMRYSHPKSD